MGATYQGEVILFMNSIRTRKFCLTNRRGCVYNLVGGGRLYDYE